MIAVANYAVSDAAGCDHIVSQGHPSVDISRHVAHRELLHRPVIVDDHAICVDQSGRGRCCVAVHYGQFGVRGGHRTSDVRERRLHGRLD